MTKYNPRVKELEQLYSLISPSADDTILDALSGSGFASLPLFGKVKQIIALDTNQAHNTKSDKMACLVCPVERVSLRDNCIDTALAHTGFHHVGAGKPATQHLALQELYRVLKPSGTLVISDLEGQSSASQFNDDCVEGHKDKCNWIASREITPLLEKANFRDIYVKEKQVSWNFQTREEMEAFASKIFRLPRSGVLAQLLQYNLADPAKPAINLPFWYARGVK